MAFFYLVTTGWIFGISLCENSINQSINHDRILASLSFTTPTIVVQCVCMYVVSMCGHQYCITCLRVTLRELEKLFGSLLMPLLDGQHIS